jgi:hypothetical protein
VEVGGHRHAPVDLPPGGTTVPVVQEAGWTPGPVWRRVNLLYPPGFEPANRPARVKSIYCLRCRGPVYVCAGGNCVSQTSNLCNS